MFEQLFSFGARNDAVEVGRHLSRLSDLTIPNDPGTSKLDRFENRNNRSLPALLCPWEKGKPIVSKAMLVITKDVADRGVGLILNQRFDPINVMIGLHVQPVTGQEPWFFLGAKRSEVPIGSGFWSMGVEIKTFLKLDERPELAPLLPIAQKLLSPSYSETRDSISLVESLIDQLDDLP